MSNTTQLFAEGASTALNNTAIFNGATIMMDGTSMVAALATACANPFLSTDAATWCSSTLYRKVFVFACQSPLIGGYVAHYVNAAKFRDRPFGSINGILLVTGDTVLQPVEADALGLLRTFYIFMSLMALVVLLLIAPIIAVVLFKGIAICAKGVAALFAVLVKCVKSLAKLAIAVLGLVFAFYVIGWCLGFVVLISAMTTIAIPLVPVLSILFAFHVIGWYLRFVVVLLAMTLMYVGYCFLFHPKTVRFQQGGVTFPSESLSFGTTKAQVPANPVPHRRSRRAAGEEPL